MMMMMIIIIIIIIIIINTDFSDCNLRNREASTGLNQPPFRMSLHTGERGSQLHKGGSKGVAYDKSG
jgi:hypothetical protein